LLDTKKQFNWVYALIFAFSSFYYYLYKLIVEKIFNPESHHPQLINDDDVKYYDSSIASSVKEIAVWLAIINGFANIFGAYLIEESPRANDSEPLEN
jgi:hypothetical protein